MLKILVCALALLVLLLVGILVIAVVVISKLENQQNREIARCGGGMRDEYLRPMYNRGADGSLHRVEITGKDSPQP